MNKAEEFDVVTGLPVSKLESAEPGVWSCSAPCRSSTAAARPWSSSGRPPLGPAERRFVQTLLRTSAELPAAGQIHMVRSNPARQTQAS